MPHSTARITMLRYRASWVHGTEENELLDATAQSGILLGPDSVEVPDLYFAFAQYESSTFSDQRSVRYPTRLLKWMEVFLDHEIMERMVALPFIVDEMKYLRKGLVRFAWRLTWVLMALVCDRRLPGSLCLLFSIRKRTLIPKTTTTTAAMRKAQLTSTIQMAVNTLILMA
jgi:hypothetical protein